MGSGLGKYNCHRRGRQPRREEEIMTHVVSVSEGDAVRTTVAADRGIGSRRRPRAASSGRTGGAPPRPPRTASWKRANITVRTKVIRTPAKKDGNPVGIDHTPVGTEKGVYKFYCPVCMLHFREVLETECCKNYTCYSCALAFVRGKGGLKNDINHIPVELPPIPCMHCNTTGLKLKYVDVGARPRDYADSPDTKMALHRVASKGNCQGDGNCGGRERKALSFDDESSLMRPGLDEDDVRSPSQSPSPGPEDDVVVLNPAEDEADLPTKGTADVIRVIDYDEDNRRLFEEDERFNVATQAVG